MTKESKLKKKAVKLQRRIRRTMDDTLKLKVVLESLKESVTMNELASKFEVHPTQIRTWRTQFLKNAGDVFSGNKSEKKELDGLRKEREGLHQRIGEQTMDIQFLKKKLQQLN